MFPNPLPRPSKKRGKSLLLRSAGKTMLASIRTTQGQGQRSAKRRFSRWRTEVVGRCWLAGWLAFGFRPKKGCISLYKGESKRQSSNKVAVFFYSLSTSLRSCRRAVLLLFGGRKLPARDRGHGWDSLLKRRRQARCLRRGRCSSGCRSRSSSNRSRRGSSSSGSGDCCRSAGTGLRSDDLGLACSSRNWDRRPTRSSVKKERLEGFDFGLKVLENLVLGLLALVHHLSKRKHNE